jgi:hypothetical protein
MSRTFVIAPTRQMSHYLSDTNPEKTLCSQEVTSSWDSYLPLPQEEPHCKRCQQAISPVSKDTLAPSPPLNPDAPLRSYAKTALRELENKGLKPSRRIIIDADPQSAEYIIYGPDIPIPPTPIDFQDREEVWIEGFIAGWDTGYGNAQQYPSGYAGKSNKAYRAAFPEGRDANSKVVKPLIEKAKAEGLPVSAFVRYRTREGWIWQNVFFYQFSSGIKIAHVLDIKDITPRTP